MRKTVLIIKLGYCETLVHEEGFVPSLGDVFRHTVLLHHYADYRVTWLTSRSSVPLLTGNPYIQELLVYDDMDRNALAKRQFDEVLCLEKAPTLCSLAQSVCAAKHLGFGRTSTGTHAFPGAESALDVANGRDQFLPIQALLFQIVGSYWRGQDYVLGYEPRERAPFDVGINFRVGSKWPTKNWPVTSWETLATLCENHGLVVSWQEGATDLYQYMDWINAARLVVTCDSLGMHLGLAMRKKVVALFGPTPSEQIYMYGRGVILTADWACPEAPCMQAECAKGVVCMSQIRPRTVARTIGNLLNGKEKERDAITPRKRQMRLAS